jgi:hypothetical protein
MAYADVSVIVDGALEESETFHDETLMNDYIGKIEDEAKDHGYETQIYVVFHEHEDLEGDQECQCIQYLTDHHPYATFNQESQEA